jgi:hypothetical protein
MAYAILGRRPRWLANCNWDFIETDRSLANAARKRERRRADLSWNKRSRTWAPLGIVGFLALLPDSLAFVQPALGQSASAESVTDMDRAIALLDEARMHFRNVRDYECRLLKQEQVRGVLLPQSEMLMRVRNEPFSVYLRCESPNDDKGLEVCYVAGRNRGMMRVHPTGFLSIFGFQSLDPRDSRAFEKNRHCITEAGLGNMLESTARYWEMERRLNETLVRITDEAIAGRACTRIETIHPDRNAGAFYGYRCVLWLDKATHLPAGSETYDWPRAGNGEGGGLLESYRYLDLRCNIGLGDDAFDY